MKECEIIAKYLNFEVDMGQHLSRTAHPGKGFKMSTNNK